MVRKEKPWQNQSVRRRQVTSPRSQTILQLNQDDPLATAGTGGKDDPKGPNKPRASNPASVAVPEQGDALEEGPGPAEGHTDNRAGG